MYGKFSETNPNKQQRRMCATKLICCIADGKGIIKTHYTDAALLPFKRQKSYVLFNGHECIQISIPIDTSYSYRNALW